MECVELHEFSMLGMTAYLGCRIVLVVQSAGSCITPRRRITVARFSCDGDDDDDGDRDGDRDRDSDRDHDRDGALRDYEVIDRYR
ncbi:hypothetical protein CIB48_g8572 [Xylaria polymorpha]|nr:hypothetical protein CIB48_g8572 [Xylaria polymorpha]